MKHNTIRQTLFALPLVAGALWLRASAQAPVVEAPSTSAKASVYFSPRGGAQQAVVRELAAAKSSVWIQAYSFTSAPIAAAILDAHKRGVPVRAILDESNETAQYSSASFLTNVGIPVLIDYRPAIAHSKVMILDGSTIITGSFNFTKSAEERNVENLLVLKDCPDLVKSYQAHFERRAALSRPYQRKEK